MPGRVAVVTDSAACLESPSSAAGAIIVVPLRVLAGGVAADDAAGALPDPIADALRRGERLSTARPSPQRFAAAYAAAAAAGAPAIVSVHLSGELSGTIGSAQLAATSSPVPVQVVDSRSIGGGLGIVAATAALAAAAGRSAAEVADAAIRQAARLGSFFALDSQDQLRAGGRLTQAGRVGAVLAARPREGTHPGEGLHPGEGPAAAGSMLRSRPLLQIRDGRIVVLERVRTRSAARDRLTELAARFAAGQPCDLVVQHLDNPAGADILCQQLRAAIPAAGQFSVVTAGTAIRAHTGPGLLGVVIAPHGDLG
jgi:fatty acid-binding protein DegV